MTIELQRIEGINRHESKYLYEEIFVRRAYLRHGLALSADAIVFDVGANIGMFSLFVLSEHPSASIYAFEPLPPIFEKLLRNVSRISKRAQLFCCGVSDAPGEANFTFYPGYSMMSAKSEYAHTAADKELVRRKAVAEHQRYETHADGNFERNLEELLNDRFQEVSYRCPLRSLSEVIDEHRVPRIDFLKIDVQRAEIDVLNGLRDDHWPLVQQVVMEVHERADDFTRGRVRAITDILTTKGFRVMTEQYEGLSETDRHNVFARRIQSA